MLNKKNALSTSSTGKIRYWLKLISIVGSAQFIVQLTGFVCGILVIRLLPVHEYALYTLANTMLGTMTLLADSGIATGVMSQGGKVWQDRQKLGSVLATGMRLRKIFAAFTLLITIPLLYYMLNTHDASWLMSTMIILSLIPTFYTALSGTLLTIAPKLRQDIIPLQKVQITSNAIRLTLLGLFLFIYPLSATAIFCGGASQIWANWKLRKISDSYADASQPIDHDTNNKIIEIVKNIMPNTVYYSISGQMTIWLISIFGSTKSIAEIGALGRLSMLFSIFFVLLQVLAVPRFAKLEKNSKNIMKYYLGIQSIIAIVSIFIIATIWTFPSQTLWILGKNYSDLYTEVVLIAAGSCIAMIAGSSYALLSARALLIKPIIGIPFGLITTIIIVYFIDFSSTEGALYFSLYSSTIAALFSFFSGLYLIRKI